MKTTALMLLVTVGVALGESTNVTVRIAGRLQTRSEIEQLVVAQARRAQMQFDFARAQSHFTVLSNGGAVVSMWCAQTNGSYFYATVDGRGVVQSQELTPRDAETIRTVLARETMNAVTWVWLGPDGRVGATTVGGGKQEGELFWLRRVRSGWKIHNRGTWKTLPPAIPAPDFYTG